MSRFDEIINRKKKEWNCDSLMDAAKTSRGAKLPFSSPLMTWACYGGIPRDRISEFFGDPGSGKTSTAVDLCKNAIDIFEAEHEQQLNELRSKIAQGNKNAKMEFDDLEDRGPKKVLYIDLEHAFDNEWAKTLGIPEDKLKIMQPPDVVAEDILQTLEELIETGEIGLAVLDSLPSLVPRAELEKKYGERTVAALAGLLTVFCRKIVSLLTRYETTLIFINQIRDNMDNPYVVNTPGGRAPKFYASLRIHFRQGTPVDFLGNELPQNTENPAGYIINARIVKQKSAPFDRKNASYFLMCTSGIHPEFDFAKLAITKYGIIIKRGAWFSITDPYTGEILEDDKGTPIKLNGLAKVYEYLNNEPEYFDSLKTFIMNDISGKPQNPYEEDTEDDSEDAEDDESNTGSYSDETVGTTDREEAPDSDQ